MISFYYFRLSHFIASNTATAKNICNLPDGEDGISKEELIKRLNELCEKILDPLYKAWYEETGYGFIISSGYRNRKLNEEIGGASDSAHSHGYGVDLVPEKGRVTVFQVFVYKWLIENKINFDQYIDELSKYGNMWVHIGLYRPTNKEQRKEMLYYRNGKYRSILSNDEKYK